MLIKIFEKIKISIFLSLALILLSASFASIYAAENVTDTKTFYINTQNASAKLDKNGKAFLKAKQIHGKDVITLTNSINGRTANLAVGTIIMLQFPENDKSEILVTPSKGVVENAPGKYYLPNDHIGILKVVGHGSATIQVKTKMNKNSLINAANTSNNWSGYARKTGGPFTNVTSIWTVPTASSCNLGDTYSSAWIGIDGATNSNLIQTGTESDCISGNPFYQAWWEILPNVAQPITSNVVNAGDTMYAEIKKNTSNWTISIKNLTQNWTFSTTQTYSGSQSSTEWIVEAPTINGSLATLTSYGTASFINDTQNQSNPSHSNLTDSIDMLDSSSATISAVSLPNVNLNGFSTAYGSTAPNPPGGSWTNVGTSIYTRMRRTATLLASGKVLAVGGEAATGPFSQAELYNPTTKSWSSTGALSTARIYHTAHLVSVSGGGTRGLVIGGYGGSSALNSCELYNESTGTWSAAANLNTPRYTHASVVLNDGTVLAIGGTNSSVLTSVELYDPVANTWTNKASMSAARGSHTATLLNDGRIFVAGGNSATTTLASTEVYDPSTNSWSAGPAMTYSRAGHTATLLPNGKVLLAGGSNSSGSSGKTAELYDPSTNTISTAAPMNYAHTNGSKASLVTLSDGVTQKVLITGGTGNLGTFSEAELYDYINNRWNVTIFMLKGRVNHTATVLNDGTVLVSGGGISPSGQTSLTEYYTAP